HAVWPRAREATAERVNTASRHAACYNAMAVEFVSGHGPVNGTSEGARKQSSGETRSVLRDYKTAARPPSESRCWPFDVASQQCSSGKGERTQISSLKTANLGHDRTG